MGKAKEPVLGPFDIYIYDFFELNTCRSSMANGPIPFTDIYNFATIKGVQDFEEYLYIIRRLDQVYIKLREKDANGRKDHKGDN